MQIQGASEQDSLEGARFQAEGFLEKMIESGAEGEEGFGIPSEPQSLICEIVVTLVTNSFGC